MAEQKRTRRRSKSGDDGDSNRKQRRSRKRTSGAELAKSARDELAGITGLEPESVTAVEQAEDGTWIVTVELLELSRIPDTDDVLGSYEVQLDDSGELLGYRRLRRYPRSHAGEEQAVGES
jgi:hypothetical protein